MPIDIKESITESDLIYEIPCKIKKIRKSRNMSQERFGKKLGLSGKTISAYETGRAMPPTQVLRDISITFDELIMYGSVDLRDNLYTKIDNIKQFVKEIETILGYYNS